MSDTLLQLSDALRTIPGVLPPAADIVLSAVAPGTEMPAGGGGLEFTRTWCLWAAVPACLLVWWLFVHFDRRREAALAKLVHPRFRHRLTPGFSPGLRSLKRWLWITALLLLFVAAAGPRKGYQWREVKRRGIDILFAVDTSKSMLAADLTPNRLERARLGIHDFVNRLDGDRVGLVPFAGNSYALCPLTTDYDAFRESLDALDTDLIPKQGTDVATAIREADRLFEEQGNNHRILVLITDGEDLQGDAIDAAEDAAKNGMNIYPVGVGSAEGVTIPVTYENGQTDVVRDSSGTPVLTRLDEDTLRKIADATGGTYVPMGRRAEGLDSIYREKLRLVPKNELDSKMELVPLEQFEWPLGAALLLLIMEFLLPDRRREAKARALPSAARRHHAAASTATLIAAGLWLGSPQAARAADDAGTLYNEGTEAYQSGSFDKAVEKLKSALNTADLQLQTRVYYNLGNAHFRIGQEAEAKDAKIAAWEESVKAYADALTLNPTDEDARFNHDLVKRKLDQLKKPEDEKDKDKKDKEKDDKEKKEKENEEKDKEEQKQDEGTDKKDQQGDEKKEEDKKEGSQENQKQDPNGDKSQQDPNGDKSQEDPKGDQSQQDPNGDKSQQDSNGEKARQDPNGEKSQQDPNGDKSQQDPNSDQSQQDPNGDKSQQDPNSDKSQQDPKGDKSQQAPNGDKSQQDPNGDKDKAAKTSEDKPGEAGKEGEQGIGKDGKPDDGKPGEKRDENGKPMSQQNSEGDPKARDEGSSAVSEERRRPGEMTAAEARQLLQTLRRDQATVIPIERPPPQSQRLRRYVDPNNTVKGKTW